MQWQDLIGHEQQRAWFARAVEQQRLASTFLFVGPDGSGKRTFARLLAKSLLCRKAPVRQLAPCGACPDCVQVEASTHPDLIEIAKAPEKSTLPLEAIIGPPEARHSEGLCHEISLRPFSGRRKVAILDDADFLAAEGANALLKTLEEPPADSLLILISSSLQKQLPTIRSRSQVVRFQPLSPEELTQLMLRQGLVDSPERARTIAEQSDGGLGTARTLADPELSQFRALLLERLTSRELDFIELAKAIGSIAEKAGKEAIIRRPRIKLLLKMTADFYRAVALRLSGAPLAVDADLARNVEQRLQHWPGGAAAALACWQRSLDALEHVDRNANQTALLEDWAANLAAASRC
jgi:DNA polymerase III subunit delta'